MYSFQNDYSEGAHPRVLQALTDTNLIQTCGYGLDPICEEARNLIRTLCAAPGVGGSLSGRRYPDQPDGHRLPASAL